MKIISYHKEKEIISNIDIEATNQSLEQKQNTQALFEDIEKEKKLKYRTNIFGLKAPKDRIIISLDLDYKNWVKLNNSKIRLERDYDNMNRRYVAPTNAFVIDAENIPTGTEIIVNHNSDHDVNRIFSVDEDIDVKGIHYYSIPKIDAYIWKDKNNQWQPCEGYALGERVYEPYKGCIIGIADKELEDYIYITSECDIKGKVAKTMKNSLYEMVFNDENAQEHRIIRIRHNQEREEVLYIDNEMTKKVKRGELRVGSSK